MGVKSKVGFFCFLAVFLAAAGISQAQNAYISGTWLGRTEVPEMPEMDEVTLVLVRENNIYFGTISDSQGIVEETECEDLVFKDGTLSFHFDVFNGYSTVTVTMMLKVEGDTMTGEWKTDEGMSGTIEFKMLGSS